MLWRCLLLGAFARMGLTAPFGPPEQFHIAVTATPGEMIVNYVTKAQASSTCSVKGLGAFQGTSRTYTEGGWQGFIHAVKLTGLKPSTNYVYSCEGVQRELRTTPPAGAFPLRVAAVADLGEACSKPGCGNATISALAAGAAKWEFDMLLHAGDIAYTSGHQDIWDEFMREMDPSASRIPYMVCVGNHEHYFNFTGYRSRFDMPGPHSEDPSNYRRNLWGSFDVGGVHFLSFSTEHLKSPLVAEQLAFVRADLAQAKARRADVPWIVAYGHKPLYCSTDDYYDCNRGMAIIRELFEPLFSEFGVDIYLTGHLHNYERTWPVFNGTVEKQSYNEPRDTVHVVIGSAGDDEGLTNRWYNATPTWSALREGEHVGYAEMVFANASTLTFNYRNAATGTVIDSFSLIKSRGDQGGAFV